MVLLLLLTLKLLVLILLQLRFLHHPLSKILINFVAQKAHGEVILAKAEVETQMLTFSAKFVLSMDTLD